MIVSETGGADNAFRLLMVDNIPKLAETSAKAISNIKFDKVVVWDGGNGNGKDGDGTNATSNFIRGLTSSLPPAMEVLRSVGGIDGLDKILLNQGADSDQIEHMKQALKEADIVQPEKSK